MKKYFIRITAFSFLILFILSSCTDNTVEKDSISDTVNITKSINITEETMPEPTINEISAIMYDGTNLWPTYAWPYDLPENQDMDSDILDQIGILMDYYTKEEKIFGGSIIVARNGYIVYEKYSGYGKKVNEINPNASLTKSFVSALTGIAIDEGYIGSVDDKVLDYFTDLDIQNIDEMKKSLTIRDVLTMQSGLKLDDNVFQKEYPLLEILSAPMSKEPGTYWKYDNSAPSILTAIIQKTTGKTAFEYAKEKLFEPIGITSAIWDSTPSPGISNTAGAGLDMTAKDLLRFGHLYLHKGIWDGKRIISEDWINESTSPRVDVGKWDLYSYLWWGLKGISADGYKRAKNKVVSYKINAVDIPIPEEIDGELYFINEIFEASLKEDVKDGEIYRATGLGGQYIYVWPKYNIVVVMTTASYNPPSKDIFTYEINYGDYGNNKVLGFVLRAINDAFTDWEKIEEQKIKVN